MDNAGGGERNHLSSATRRAAEELIVDLDGFEGPLDLLLTLARRQKVDLRHVSVLQLADQYMAFIERAKALRIELAADYLVMAAWLAFLKSRLLLPQDVQEGDEQDDAVHLAFRLQRLEAMRDAAARLMARDQLGRDVFARGRVQDEAAAHGRTIRIRHTAGLLDLMQAYARIKTREDFRPYTMDRENVLSLEEALARLKSLIGDTGDWEALMQFLPQDWQASAARRASATASTFAAALELTRQGQADLRQPEPFAPIEIRARHDPRS